ncbi:hypothetical protein [Pengzhenrongella frigida]|uniref:DUF1129 family protein n=1 Tax=Pengzhenrongella frigida TaxID=1259133 RepID=A0A4Q5MWF1_9MICO|nr:hypothetical protein [Cellulomonas sp. HLT2-17]RYV49916.1 hypothetical protein EUA98_16220 [Cellulomonas sp. HLT2-17]
MSSPVESPKDPSPLTLERRLAPHVDGAWAEDFVLELRLLGVAGDRIGAALTEVESHCADSSEGAPDAFGDAVTYARSLDLPVDDDESPRAVLRALAPTAVQLAGMFILSWSFGPALSGGPLEITVGHLAGAIVAALAIAMVVRVADPALRLLVRHPVRAGFLLWAWLVAVTGACVAALLLLDAPLWRIGAAWGVAAGAGLLAAGAAWAYADIRADRGLADPITSPLGPLPPSTSRRGRLLESPAFATLTATAVIPAGTLGLLALTLALHATTT